MNSLKSLIASALLAILSVSVSPAGTEPAPQAPAKPAFAAVMYPATNACRMWLNVEKYQTNAKVRIELINQRGEVLFGAGLPKKHNKLRQSFDLSQIGDGTYTFRVSNGIQTEAFAFRVSTPTVETLPTRLISLK